MELLVFNGSGIRALKAKLKMPHMRNLLRSIHLWEVHRGKHAGQVVRIWRGGQFSGYSRVLLQAHREKSQGAGISFKGPLFRVHMIVSATEIHFVVAHIFQKTVKYLLICWLKY